MKAATQGSFQSTAIEDTRVLVLSPDAGVVTYRAAFAGWSALVSTCYRKRDGRWWGVLYQQTVLQGTDSSG